MKWNVFKIRPVPADPLDVLVSEGDLEAPNLWVNLPIYLPVTSWQWI